MSLTFKPELSFFATIHWEMVNGRAAVHGLSATYVDSALTAADSGWIYCSAGDTYSGLKPIGIDIDLATGRLVGLKFWFACYQYADGDQSYRYELCAFDDLQAHNPFQFHTLNLSRNGYLGLYPARMPDEHGHARQGALWDFKGLDPQQLEEGAEVANVMMIGPEKRRMRRLVEDYFPYLNDRDGHDALFTIKVVEGGMQRPW